MHGCSHYVYQRCMDFQTAYDSDAWMFTLGTEAMHGRSRRYGNDAWMFTLATEAMHECSQKVRKRCMDIQTTYLSDA